MPLPDDFAEGATPSDVNGPVKLERQRANRLE